MHDEVDRALRMLDEDLAAIMEATPATWLAMVRRLVEDVVSDPFLRTALPVETVQPGDEGFLWGPADLNGDPSKWGPRAFQSLHFFLIQDPGIYQGERRLESHPLSPLYRQQRRRETGKQFEPVLIEPLVTWLRRWARAVKPVDWAVERWIQRTLWVDCARRLDQESALSWDEDVFQRSFHRYLFDQGLDVRYHQREVGAGRNRVDFLLSTGPFPVIVEMKRWRGPEDDGRLRLLSAQAVEQYAEYQTCRLVYMIVINQSADLRLVLDGHLEDLLSMRVQARIRVVDIGCPKASRDDRRRHAVATSALRGEG
jgi:hypothetical protein